MAWVFGDGFDLYAAPADMINGYWDSGSGGASTFVAGRFSGSNALKFPSVNSDLTLVKSSGQNDAVHHIAVAYNYPLAITGTNQVCSLILSDGTTAQCTITFRSDGAILLQSGTLGGTTLATYTGAFPATSTWYQFEFEVVINSTTGSFKVRKNGNSTEDFTATALNTRPVSANNYANKLTISSGVNGSTRQSLIDDLFWQSSSAAGTWLGDIRCYTRMPASDASVVFSRTPTSATQTPFATSSSIGIVNTVARYTPFIAAYDGTIGTATVSLVTGYTGNMKCSIFASSGTVPTAVLGSATVITNPATGSSTLTFGTPVAVLKGTQYWIGFSSDTSSGLWQTGPGAAAGLSSTTAYASFPAASPSTATTTPTCCTLTYSITTNNCLVSEAQQDALTSYVYDSTVGHEDYYGIASIASTPATVIATTTRAYMQKSDAGTRTAAVQLKSGATTVASPTVTLTTSGWLWAWRTDTTDPATGAAWTPAAVNTVQIGPKTVA